MYYHIFKINKNEFEKDQNIIFLVLNNTQVLVFELKSQMSLSNHIDPFNFLFLLSHA